MMLLLILLVLLRFVCYDLSSIWTFFFIWRPLLLLLLVAPADDMSALDASGLNVSCQVEEAEDRLREEGSRCSELEQALEAAEKRYVCVLFSTLVDLFRVSIPFSSPVFFSCCLLLSAANRHRRVGLPPVVTHILGNASCFFIFFVFTS